MNTFITYLASLAKMTHVELVEHYSLVINNQGNVWGTHDATLITQHHTALRTMRDLGAHMSHTSTGEPLVCAACVATHGGSDNDDHTTRTCACGGAIYSPMASTCYAYRTTGTHTYPTYA